MIGRMKPLKRLFAPPYEDGAQVDPGFAANEDTHYLDVIDRLEERLAVQRYLEIGSRHGTSLARRSCSYVAIDPEFAIRGEVFNGAPQQMFFQQTSDEFFGSGVLEGMGWVPDLAFIDGMHLYEYALRDFMNCERAMTTGGVICLHDVVPFNHAMTTRDLAYLETGKPWTGDVWKVMAILAEYRPDLRIELLSAHKTGLGVVSGLDPENDDLQRKAVETRDRFQELTLAEYGAEHYFSRFPVVAPEECSLLSADRPASGRDGAR